MPGKDDADYISHICRASEHLMNLIDDLLDISRIEAGRLNITLKSIPVKNIISESLAIVQSMADAAHIKIIDHASTAEMPHILADHTRTKQSLVNLLTNAIKYNNKNGTVTLALKPSGRLLRFEITDTGPGIAADQHQTIFQPFTRLKSSEYIKGTGIGLTITRRLIDAMNGTIGLNSTPGSGSTFWFELPLTEAEEVQTTETQDFLDTYIGNVKNPFSILYIEDEPLNQALVRSIIKQLPETELTTAVSAEEGIEYVREKMPDIILMDINLPGINGFEALKILQAETDLSRTVVYAVSANAMPDEISRGKQAGFHDYLIKPIDIDNTRRMLTKTLKELDKNRKQN
jgi:CheY-like chemotaxis protein